MRNATDTARGNRDSGGDGGGAPGIASTSAMECAAEADALLSFAQSLLGARLPGGESGGGAAALTSTPDPASLLA